MKAADVLPGDVIVTRTGAARIVVTVEPVNGNQLHFNCALPPISGPPEWNTGARFDRDTPVICLARNYPLGDAE